jgi:toxin ParE1/3/4
VTIEPHEAVIADDLPSIYAFVAKDDPAAAERLLAAIEDTFAQLAIHPEIGVVYPTRDPRFRAVRMLPVHPFATYLVFYRVTSEAVRILYVVHGARHLPRLFRRDPRS